MVEVPLMREGGMAGGSPAVHSKAIMDALAKSVNTFVSQIKAARTSKPGQALRPGRERLGLDAGSGDSHFSTSSSGRPLRVAYDSTWSRPMRPTLKYFACGCEK